MTRLLLLALAACGPTITTDTVTDGSVCRKTDTVVFMFDTCLSSSCDTVTSTSCTATLDGTTITVVGEAVIERTSGDCTADCGFVEVECDLPDTSGLEGVTFVVGDETVAWEDAECGV